MQRIGCAPLRDSEGRVRKVRRKGRLGAGTVVQRKQLVGPKENRSRARRQANTI